MDGSASTGDAVNFKNNIIIKKFNSNESSIISSFTSKGMKQIKVSDCQEGAQPDGTFIIGTFVKEMENPKMLEAIDSSWKSYLYLNEVMEDKTTSIFRVVLHDRYAPTVQEFFKNHDLSDCCVVFDQAHIDFNTDSRHLPLILRLNEQDITSSNPKVFIYYKDKENVMEYTTLKDLVAGSKCNVFGVVADIVKYMKVLPNGNRHTLLAITDDSLDNKEIIFHAFSNYGASNFKKEFNCGDILRIRDMRIDRIPTDDGNGFKITGKVVHPSSITHFVREEPNNKVTPITLSDKYCLTEQDREKVLHLRDWWSKLNSEIYENLLSENVDGHSNEKTIEEVTKEMTFDLSCKIINVRKCSVLGSTLVVVVTDGTTCQVRVNCVSVIDASQDLVSQTDKAVVDSKEIYITVTSDHSCYDQFLTLEAGDFINIRNLKVIYMESDQSNEVLLDFVVDNSTSLCKLALGASKVRIIERRLKVSDKKIDDDNVLKLANRLTSLQGTNQTPVDNVDMDQNLVEESPQINPIPVPSPITNSSNFANGDPLPSNTPQLETIVGETDSSHAVKKPLIVTLNDFLEYLNSPRNIKENSNAKGVSSCLNKESFESFTALQENLDLDVSSSINNSLALLEKNLKYSESCPVGESWSAKVTIRTMYCITDSPCGKCGDMFCTHDWIWAVCTQCAYMMNSATLRKDYSSEVLMEGSPITCPSCKMGINMTPVYNLSVSLQDQEGNILEVGLTGCNAERFLGIEPSFRITVGQSLKVLYKFLFYLEDHEVVFFWKFKCFQKPNCPKIFHAIFSE